MLKRSFSPPSEQSYFLFGPRGTGKSQFLRMCYKDRILLDLLDDKTQLDYSTHPEKLETLVMAMNDKDILIIDEVQRAPSILAKIHQLIEDPHFPKIIYILTGSSARKLKREGVDLLAGRAIVKTMHPFVADELGEHFNFKLNLKFGMLPLVWGSPNPQETLNSYIALYLKEEIKAERFVKSLESFSRFLEAMTYSHGEVLNLSNISRESGVKRSTCDGHLEILEDLLLGYRIPIFKKKNRKQTIDTDKFYFFDSGVYQSLKPKGPLDDPGTTIGPALEGFVEQHLRAWLAYKNNNDKIYYWRTKSGNEVDFIIYGDQTFHALEVKNTTKIHRKDFSGLKSFLEDYPEAKAWFLYRGDKIEIHGKITCIPIQNFLMNGVDQL